ncbi:MAG: pyridoxamine 5'-phosphate oxidase family protein [Burkholderiaceae bacterium]|nr:pyridoxamine 5'-phosphate oxidase family protein [Burkholderiaceae bacterium]
MHIETIEQLRALYAPAKERARLKQLAQMDPHCRRFIELSPFVVMASSDAGHGMDASPRGGAPGFAKTLDPHTVLIGDAPGNNRLDTLENILATGTIGLLFMIPGVDETLRINGTARLTCDPAVLRLFDAEKNRPRLAIEVTVTQAYLHCAKALMRSRLWHPSALQDRSVLPTMGEMIGSQIGMAGAPESQEAMLARYVDSL